MRLLPTLLLLCTWPSMADPTLIGHPGLPALDKTTVQRIYTGRIIELNGVRLTPVNLPAGNPIRTRFLSEVMGQEEDKYTGYWTVRRYVGKGTPPRELSTAAEVIEFVTSTTGAIGYVDESDTRPGINILLRPAR